jgi:hypothetical protein
MPKRPRSHEIEEFSRGRLRDLFGRLGWVVWDLHPDYGEDLLVRIFTDGAATHYSFFVQAKATDHIDRYMDKEGANLNFPIDVDHLKYWEQFWEPVILTVWDSVSDITYWEIVQDYLESNDVNISRKRLSISIPKTNILDDIGLKRIQEETISRFQRFELTCEGVYALADLLEKSLNVKVVYEPGDDTIGVFHYSKDTGERERLDLICLGDLAEMALKAAEITKKTPQQLFEQYVDEQIKSWLDNKPSHLS